ncbi:MAG: DUF2933 domain-containing protein [Candidatus Methanoperedens sp.]|nr:DUF2933 domain-containing protein [Candidatus Methanoperedens sp.]MCZ7396547.1 DUF2933 domain-containing protein [Candidatus Methanoperedens sp.]
MGEESKTPYLNTGNNKSKHTLLMILGCLVPLVILGILWLAGVSQNIIFFGILLLCPVMHLVMMKNMNHGNIESKINNNEKKEEFT